MYIIDYQTLIQNLPHLKQAFTIKSENWEDYIFNDVVKELLEGNEYITLNRQDLFSSSKEIDQLIVKVLMWGYPTGRLLNKDRMLKPDKFEEFCEILNKLKNQDISYKCFRKTQKDVSGLGISTYTKLLYFLNIKLDGYKTVILDSKIINVIKQGTFIELLPLTKDSNRNALIWYSDYLKIINDLALKMKADPGQVELFLFIFGQNLSPVKEGKGQESN